jgi:hypothetical protein
LELDGELSMELGMELAAAWWTGVWAWGLDMELARKLEVELAMELEGELAWKLESELPVELVLGLVRGLDTGWGAG